MTHRSGVDAAQVSAEAYSNRYKNAWTASSMAAKQFYDDCSKRRGRPPSTGGHLLVPLSEVPVPVPISRFLWPQARHQTDTRIARSHCLPVLVSIDWTTLQSQGRGNARMMDRCGNCLHCTDPLLSRGCLSPTPRAADDDSGCAVK